MRYWKGSIVMSPARDLPLLREVLRSDLITHDQLFESLRLDYCLSSRKAFNNRVLRLIRHGLLTRHEKLVGSHGVVYSVSSSGASTLEMNGDRVTDSPGTRSPSIQTLRHCLDLNEIHLALKRSGSLVYWMPETEVRSRCDLTPYGYGKYYDAVVVVRLAGLDCKFALEYERTLKGSRHYAAICTRIEQETAIRHFLYLVPNHEFMWFITEKLSQCRRAVYVGLLHDFLQQTLALQVRRNSSPANVILASVLADGREAQISGSLFPGFAV